MTRQVTLIGFGEAGQTFANAGEWRGDARAYDKLTDDPDARTAKLEDYRRASVNGAATPAEAVSNAELILSLVTADQALEAARSVAPALASGSLYCDLNSVAPGTKRSAADAIESAGARYVDVAIMAPVNPAKLAVPLLVSGPHANAAVARLIELGFTSIRNVGGRIGQASAIKMIRSVLVKGIEALTAECFLAADAAGVTEEVRASLDASEKKLGWAERADYSFERMIIHGLRRAEEMEEVVRTLEDLGIDPVMSRSTVARQREIGALALGRPPEGLAAKVEAVTGKKAHVA
jgi:3-hydroxyisobutyrate dehydrogenase-like beta-hydroxyacid dehydrogenase